MCNTDELVTGQTDCGPERTCVLTVQTAVCHHVQYLCEFVTVIVLCCDRSDR